MSESKNWQKRNRRIDVLQAILNEGRCTSQAEILQQLARFGYKVTQATLSRDLQTAKAAKVMTRDGYRYVSVENPLYKRSLDNQPAREDVMRESHIDFVEFSGNLGIIHTRPGNASVLASEIDFRRPGCLLGTIAGDDAVLIVLREAVTHRSVYEELVQYLPRLHWNQKGEYR